MPGQRRSEFIHRLGAGAAVAAGAPLLPLGALADDDMAKVYEAAKKEGSVSWYTSPYPQTVAETLRDAFNKKYPGVTCTLTRQTAQVIFQKISNDLQAGAHEADVVSTSELSHYTKWKSMNALASYEPPDLKYAPKTLQTLDADHAYNLGCISFVTIDYSTKISGQPAKKWTDLLDPKWKGQISTGHPGFSGFVALWAITMMDRGGWDAYFPKLAANNPKIGRSIFDVPTDIVAGERTIGIGVDALAEQLKAKGNPIGMQWPDDDAILIVSPAAVMKDAPHPNAARLLANFYYSPEFAAVCTAAYNYPPRTGVPQPNDRPFSSIKFHTVKLEDQQTKTSEVIAKWRETFGV